jgi:hypothetical protein
MAKNFNVYDGALIQFYAADNVQNAYIQLSTSDVLKIGNCSLIVDNLSLNGSGTTGIITNAQWNGSIIGVTYGGTGLSSIPSGSLLYASSNNTLTTLAPADDIGMLLVSSPGNPNVPSWSYTIGKTGQTITIAGDLVVSGTTTTINTAQMNIADNYFTLNSDYVGSSPSENAGFEINRGTLTNASFLWDETNDIWKIGLKGSEIAVVDVSSSQNLLNKTYNGLSLTSLSVGFTLSGGSTSKTLTVDSNLTASTSLSLTGTSNRITVSGSTTLSAGGSVGTIDISASYVGQTSITTLGNITIGTWSADTISVSKGGTGLTSYTIGDLLYASGTTTLSKLADVATGNVLISGGVGVAPSYGKVGLTTHVSGILPIANGGTNTSSIGAAGTNVYSNGTSFAFSTVGVIGQALISGGSGAPTWFNPSAGTLIFGGSSGQLSYGNIIWDDSGKTLTLKYDTINTATLTAGSGGTLILHADSGSGGGIQLFNSTISQSRSVYPGKTLSVDLGNLQKKFNSIYTSELRAETLVTQDTFATVGGRVLISPSSSLIADLSSAATTIDVKHKLFLVGDIIVLEDKFTVEYMQITSAPTTISGGYRYSVTRDLDKTGANNWNAGDAVLNTGQAGTGFIDLYSFSGTGVELFDFIYNFNSTGSVYSINYQNEFSWSPFGDGANNEVNDAVYFGIALSNSSDQWNNIYINITTAAVYSATIVWEYWNGSAWTSFTPSIYCVKQSDGTYSSNPLFQDAGWYSIEWPANSLSGWTNLTLNSQTAKWVRARISSFTSWTTLPVTSEKHRVYQRKRQVGPAIVGNVRQSTTFNDWKEYWAIGNLNGLFGYGGDIYGAAFGKYSTSGSTYITIDSTNGFRILNGNTTIGQWDMFGVLTIGTIASGKSNLQIDASGNLAIRNNITNKITLNSDGSGSLASGNISWNTSGVLTAGGWTINSNNLSSTNMSLTSGSAPNISLSIDANNVVSFYYNSSTDWGILGKSSGNTVFQLGYTNKIAGWNFSNTSLISGTGSTTVGIDSGGTNPSFYAGSATPASAPFRVTNTGVLTATNANITGTIDANNGFLGALTVDGTITVGTGGSITSGSYYTLNNTGGTIAGWSINTNGISSTNIGLLSGASAMILLGDALTYSAAKIGFKNDGSGKLANGNITWDASGNITFAGSISSSATITGGTLQTSSSANTGIKITSTGINGYNGTAQTFNIASDGSGWIGVTAIRAISWATDGTVTLGGWFVDDSKFYSGTGSYYVGIKKYVSSANDIIFFAGASDNVGTSAVFKVTADGGLTTTKATLSGTLTVSGTATLSGTIQTAASGARTIVSSTGIAGYDATTQRYALVNDGSGWLGASNFISWSTTGILKVGNWTVSGTALSGTGINLTSSTDASISIGTTPPPSSSTGTGIWIDKSGIYGLVSNNVTFRLDTATGALSTNNGYLGGIGSGWIISANTISKDLMALYAATNGSYLKIGNATSYNQASTSGIWLGQVSSTNFSLSMSNGTSSKFLWDGATSTLSIIANSVTVFSSTTTGATIGGWNIDASTIKSTTNVLTLASGASPYIGLGITSYSANNGIWLGYDTSTWKFSIKNTDGSQYMLFDGSNLSWAGVNTSLSAAGAFTASNATITGNITANSGYIGGTNGWVINTNDLSTTSSTNKIRAVSASILSNDTGFILQGDGTFRVGTATGTALSKGLYWDGVNLTVKGINFELTSTGDLWAKSGGFGGLSPSGKTISMTTEGLAVLYGGIERAFVGIRSSVGSDGFRTPSPTPQTITGNISANNWGSWVDQNSGNAVSDAVNSSAQIVQTITANTSYTTGWSQFVSPENTVEQNTTYTYKFNFAGYSGNSTYVGFQASVSIQQKISSTWTTVRTINIGNASGTYSQYSISYANTSNTGNIRLFFNLTVIPNLVTGTNITQIIDTVTLEKSNYFVDLTDKGIYIYNSPDSYIKFGNGHADFIGQTVTFSNLNVLNNLQINGTLTVTGGVTITGAQTISSPIQVLNTNAIIPSGSPNVYGLEIDNNTGGANSGNTTGIYYQATSGRWGIGSRSHNYVGTESNTPVLDPVVTVQSADALIGKTSYNGLVITPNTGVITSGTWNASPIGRSYIAGGSVNHVIINDSSGNLSSEAQLSISRGGTGAGTASAAFSALSPSTTLGDLIVYGASSNQRLAGNTTTTKMFLSQTGTGSASALPVWATVTKSDVGLSNVENTALSTWTGSNYIATVGTITSGIWSGSAIADTYLQTINTAGKVSGNAITSGTIGGSTNINTSGTITASSFSTSIGVIGAITIVEYIAPTGGLPQATSLDISSAPCSPTGKSYQVGTNKLLVFVDGILQRKDTNSSAYDKDYWEIDSTHVRFNYDIAQGGVIQFIIIGW